MNKIKVSIIIPVYNRFDLVKIMVDSIINQTYKNWELLLVDDGSNDRTDEKLEEYIKGKGNILLLRRTREVKGAPSCRNIGLSRALGEYVVFFDSDDLVAPYCLEQRVSYLDEHKELDAGIFPARHFIKNIEEKNGLINGIPIYKDDLNEFLNSNLPYIVWNVIFRKSSLLNMNIKWDVNLLSLQDADFNIQCILRGLRINYCRNAKIDYFVRSENNNSISSSIYRVDRFDSHLYFVKKQFESLSINDRIKYKRALYDRLIYTYFLMSENYSTPHVNKLIGISQEYNCNPMLLKFSIRFHHFLKKRLKIKKEMANILPFFIFVISKRKRLKRRQKFNELYFSNFEINSYEDWQYYE